MVLTGVGIGLTAHVVGKNSANAVEADDSVLPDVSHTAVAAPVEVPYPGAERILDRIDEVQEAVEAIEALSNAEEIIEETVDVLSGLYTQVGLEMACYHHRAYNQVSWAGSALTTYNDEARERYTQYAANCCVSEGPRASAISGPFAFFLGDDPLSDFRGLGNIADLVLDGVNAAYTEQEWADIKAEIIASSKLQRSQVKEVCQPLIAATFTDWQQRASPPMPALE